jgi:hypothetical protein
VVNDERKMKKYESTVAAAQAVAMAVDFSYTFLNREEI